MYILFCGTNQKNVLQKEIKDSNFEVSDPSIYTISVVLKQQIYCSFFVNWGGWVGWLWDGLWMP